MSDRITQTDFLVKIDASSVKAFVAVLHLLQKIGRDLIVEVEQNVLTLRSLNDNKSSFAAVEFQDSFFDNYELNTPNSFTGRLPVKVVFFFYWYYLNFFLNLCILNCTQPICMILKNLKNVNHIIVAGVRCSAECNLTFQLHLQNGVIRSYFFCYEDCEIVNAVCDESECSFIQTRPRVMSQLLEYIHRSPELLLITKPNEFSVRSYHQINEFYSQTLHKLQPSAEVKRNSVVSTGLCVNISEFEIYDYRSQADSEALVFCVKEMASFVGFCEVLDMQQFNFYYSTGGRYGNYKSTCFFYFYVRNRLLCSAIKFSVGLDTFSVSLIMATLQHRVNRPPSTTTEEEEEAAADSSSMKAKRPRENTSKVSNISRSKQNKAHRTDQLPSHNTEKRKKLTDDMLHEQYLLEEEQTDSNASVATNKLVSGEKSVPTGESEEEDAEFGSTLQVATSAGHLFGQKLRHISVEDEDDDATIANEDEDEDFQFPSTKENLSKRQRLSQHPSHYKFYQDGHNTDDQDTEEEAEEGTSSIPSKTVNAQQFGSNLMNNKVDVKEEVEEDDVFVNKKKTPKVIPSSLQSSAGSDIIITDALNQLHRQSHQMSALQKIQQQQQTKKKAGARKFLDIESDEEDF